MMPHPRRRLSPHFFVREDDGSVRLRIRFDAERADLIERAAGRQPLLQYIDDAIREKAERDATHLDNSLQVAPPKGVQRE